MGVMLVSFSCHPTDQLPYKVTLVRLKSSLAVQLNVKEVDVVLNVSTGKFNVTVGGINNPTVIVLSPVLFQFSTESAANAC